MPLGLQGHNPAARGSSIAGETGGGAPRTALQVASMRLRPLGSVSAVRLAAMRRSGAYLTAA